MTLLEYIKGSKQERTATDISAPYFSPYEMWMQPNYANSDNLLCKEEEMSNCEADHQLILFATSSF